MNKTPFDIPADLDTPVSAFLKLQALSPCFLLESVEMNGCLNGHPLHQVGRYSLIGIGRALTLRIEDGNLTVQGVTVPLGRGQEAILHQLRDALKQAPRFHTTPFGLPFSGGLVGTASFELLHHLDKVRSQPKPTDHPTALYVAPSALVIFDHVTRRAGVFGSGTPSEQQALRERVADLLAAPMSPLPRGGALSEAVPSLSQAEFLQRVQRAKEHIQAGDVFQLVLSMSHRGETDLHPFQVYRALRLTNPSPYMYYLDLPGLQVVGSSPEALVKLQGDEAVLRPIAGTRPRGLSQAEDLRMEAELCADPKEAAEHVMLVDLARNDMGRVARPGTIEVTPFRTIERYSHVMHLVSGVRGQMEADRDPFDLFAATFPAGTVVGAPKLRAAELIAEMEPHGRGVYGGTVGYFGHDGAMDQAIAIRTLTFQQGRYTYQAGAGIVADSDPVSEYEEILSKGRAMEQALRLAAGGLV